jgi:four helix bundle protein
MSKIEKFEDIKSWQLARQVTKLIFDLSSNGDFARDFTLVNQIRRSSISIMSDIAEGFERSGDKEFVNFLSIAKGSFGEVRSQLYIALDRNYITKEQFDLAYKQLDETGKLIGGFMNYLKKSKLRGSKFR